MEEVQIHVVLELHNIISENSRLANPQKKKIYETLRLELGKVARNG